MTPSWRGLRNAATLAATIIVSGCATYNSSGFVHKIDNQYQAGLYQDAALGIETKLSLYDAKTAAFLPVTAQAGDVLLHLEAAENWRLAGNHERAIAHYDAVESLSKAEDTEGFGKKAAESIGAALVNDSVRSYEPQPAETILSNYYKAVSFWKNGQTDNARVEFNRANERARIAVERYASMIEDEQEEEAENAEADKQAKNSASSAIEAQFPYLGEWEVFDSFVNPAVAYTNALFLAQGPGADIDKAQTLLVRVRGMVGEHSVVDEDLNNLKRYGRLSHERARRWVIYEGGLSPVLNEKKFSIPWVAGSAILNISMALPELAERQNGLYLSTVQIGAKTVELEPLARMDKILRTEFKKRWPATVGRAVASAATKAVLQQEAAKRMGSLGNLAGYVYSAASTSADTRIWRAMPEHWSVAAIPADQEDVLRIPYGPGMVSEVTLPAEKNVVVYIKQPTPAAPPLVEVLTL